MILIIGGAHQGKLDFALDTFGDKTVFQCELDNVELDLQADIINSLHLLVLSLLRAEVDPEDFFAKRIDQLTDKVLISDDITSGVVPIDAEMRIWRDTLGRVLGMLSKHCDQVYRVFVGIGTRLK